MSSPGFKFFGRDGPERLERNAAGDVLKKYYGTPTSWSTHSTVQLYGQSHAQQMENIKNTYKHAWRFFDENF